MLRGLSQLLLVKQCTSYGFRIEYFSPALPLHLLHILLLQAKPLSKMNPGLAILLSKNLSPNTIINTETSSFRSYFSASVTNDNQQISSPSIDTLTSSACLRLPPLLFSCRRRPYFACCRLRAKPMFMLLGQLSSVSNLRRSSVSVENLCSSVLGRWVSCDFLSALSNGHVTRASNGVMSTLQRLIVTSPRSVLGVRLLHDAIYRFFLVGAQNVSSFLGGSFFSLLFRFYFSRLDLIFSQLLLFGGLLHLRVVD